MDIYGIEKLSLVDYEGHMTCTLFTSKCNYRCPFCHNAPLLDNPANKISEEYIFDYLIKRKGLIDAVTISGGEPTLDKDLINFIQKIKDLGYLVKLDTNGTNSALLKKLCTEKLIDYVAMDVKSSILGYPLATGSENFFENEIKGSIDFLIHGSVDYEFRTTLVYEIHSKPDIEDMKKLLSGAKRLYLQHFVDSGNCIAEGLTEVDKETALKYKTILEETIKKVELRNY